MTTRRRFLQTNSGPSESIVPVIESVKQAALTPDEKALIFSGNARRLLAAKGVGRG